jgi:kynurenine formamidase
MSETNKAKRVKFDFEVDFTNGGGIQGQDFRLDMAGTDISDRELADYLVKDMRLLMVGQVRILNKQLIEEPHKRDQQTPTTGEATHHHTKLIDLSHTISDGLVTYKGLPAPVICDYLSREQSRANYEAGTEFQIGKIEMVSNTGTYLDTPFHRYAEGKDLSQIALESMTNLEAIVIRADYRQGLSIDVDAFKNQEIQGRAVLVNTNWSDFWNSSPYYENHPYLTAEAAEYLVQSGVKLVGIDSYNIDNTTNSKKRPVHTTLLGNEILIVEHLTNLSQLPEDGEGFSFSAIPPKFKGVGTFPVRAFASL